MVGTPGGLIEPKIPIESGRQIHSRRIGVRRRFCPSIIHGAHFEEFAKSPGPHKFASNAIHGHGPLLRPNLHDALIFTGGVHEGPAFAYIEREGLLRIDVFTGVRGRGR